MKQLSSSCISEDSFHCFVDSQWIQSEQCVQINVFVTDLHVILSFQCYYNNEVAAVYNCNDWCSYITLNSSHIWHTPKTWYLSVNLCIVYWSQQSHIQHTELRIEKQGKLHPWRSDGCWRSSVVLPPAIMFWKRRRWCEEDVKNFIEKGHCVRFIVATMRH